MATVQIADCVASGARDAFATGGRAGRGRSDGRASCRANALADGGAVRNAGPDACGGPDAGRGVRRTSLRSTSACGRTTSRRGTDVGGASFSGAAKASGGSTAAGPPRRPTARKAHDVDRHRVARIPYRASNRSSAEGRRSRCPAIDPSGTATHRRPGIGDAPDRLGPKRNGSHGRQHGSLRSAQSVRRSHLRERCGTGGASAEFF